MRSMPSHLAAIALLGVLAACGAAAQDRPIVVGSFPANGQIVTGGLSEIRVLYDEPVTLLNPADIKVFSGAFQLPTFASQRPGEPNSIYVQPVPGWSFPPSTTIVVQLVQGAVINGASHYADGIQLVGFDIGPEPAVPVGHPGRVTLLDADTFGGGPSLNTPIGREAVGLLATTHAAGRRIWVQLDHGNGIGEALAFFAPTDAAMTPVTLVTGGGDLSADAAAITHGPYGRFVYLAYRHDATGTVRLYKVDVVTGTEVAQLPLLSVPASGSTRPAGMTFDDSGALLLVNCDDGATGTLAYVGLVNFVELDRDQVLAGTQGVTLAAGAGPMTYVAGNAAISEPGTADVTFATTATNAVTQAGSSLTGTGVGILRTGDGILLLEPLAGYALGQAVQVRSLVTSYLTTAGLVVSDDLGGIPAGATDAIAMTRFVTGSKFLVLLASPGGRLMARLTYNFQTIVQDDLNTAIAGIQSVDVQGIVPDATVLGRNVGEFAPP